MDTRQCLEILELECVTSPKQLKDAYRKMVKLWHPDRFHDNSGLAQQAEVKIREINRAYKHLLTYFDPNLSKFLKTACHSSDKESAFDQNGCRSASSQRQRSSSFSGTNNAGHKNSAQFDHIKIYAAPKKSVIGRLALCAVFCFFTAVTCLVVYLIFNFDKITSGTRGIASGVLEKVEVDLEHELAAKIKKIGGAQINLPPDPADEKNSGEEFPLSNNKEYYEIHLDGGTIIMTQEWWNEGDMVMFRQYGGAMGIEKGRVKKIVAQKGQ
jgi:DnaJ domain